MDRPEKVVWGCLGGFLAVPILFVVIFCVIMVCYGSISDARERKRSARELQTFLHDHQAWIAERQARPGVNTFTLRVDPAKPHVLLVTIDVNDKKAFLDLDSDLYEVVPERVRRDWDWQTTVRSKERLGLSTAGVAQGIGMAAEATTEVTGVAIISAIASVVIAFLALWCLLPEFRQLGTRFREME